MIHSYPTKIPISDDSGTESFLVQGKPHSHFVVVAIDFGTTYSGYAFAFTRDMDSILMMRKVDGNDPGMFEIRWSIMTNFFFFSLSFRCDQSENTDNNSFYSQLRISFIRFFCTRLFSWSRSRWIETMVIFRKIQNVVAFNESTYRWWWRNRSSSISSRTLMWWHLFV